MCWVKKDYFILGRVKFFNEFVFWQFDTHPVHFLNYSIWIGGILYAFGRKEQFLSIGWISAEDYCHMFRIRGGTIVHPACFEIVV